MPTPTVDLPPMPAVWPVKRIDPNDAVGEALLANLQANILRDHGRDLGLLVFFQFGAAGDNNRKALGAAADLVTSALEQYRAARDYEAAVARKDGAALPEVPILTLSLSRTGFEACALTGPTDETDTFAGGMEKRMAARPGESEPMKDPPKATWEEPLQRILHGVWMIAAGTADGLASALAAVQQWMGDYAVVRHDEPQPCGRWRPGPSKKAREPFGFADGISVPEFIVTDKFRGNDPSIDIPLAQVLIADAGSEHRGGSFLVLRKLEQNVDAFRTFEGKLKGAVAQAGGEAALAESLIVGRDHEGNPLAPDWTPAKDPNDFSFDPDCNARRCPFDAHIRKANPRFPHNTEGLPLEAQIGAQMVRRSMVYGIGQLTLDGPVFPTEKVGLWFMAYMRSIEAQFLTMHSFWMMEPEKPLNTLKPGVPRFSDPLLFGGLTPTEKNPNPTEWSWRGIRCGGLQQFVKPRGGEFFFTPSLRWLANVTV